MFQRAIPAQGSKTTERDFVGRVFAGGGADFLGVRFDSVPVGEASHFVLTAGASGISQGRWRGAGRGRSDNRGQGSTASQIDCGVQFPSRRSCTFA